MTRRLLAVALAVMAFLTVAQPQAHADFAVGMIDCAGDEPTLQCWNVIGVAANIQVYTVPNMACAGQFVHSIYLREDINNFVEFGWGTSRNFCLAQSPPTMFVKAVAGGDVVLEQDIAELSNGTYRFLIYRLTGTMNQFRFAYDPPGCGGGACRVYLGLYPAMFFYMANARTAVELTPASCACSPKNTTNVWVQSGASPYPWKPANPSYGTEMHYFDDGATWYDNVVFHQSGSTGDTIKYLAA